MTLIIILLSMILIFLVIIASQNYSQGGMIDGHLKTLTMFVGDIYRSETIKKELKRDYSTRSPFVVKKD